MPVVVVAIAQVIVVIVAMVGVADVVIASNAAAATVWSPYYGWSS